MASMSWEWEDFWNWVEAVEESERKGWIIKHALDISWLGRLSVDNQVEVLEYAPFEVLKFLKKLYPDCLKPETVSILNEHLKARYKPKRRTKRK